MESGNQRSIYKYFKESYTPKLWEDSKKKFDTLSFPMNEVTKLISDKSDQVQLSNGNHFVDKEKHTITKVSYYQRTKNPFINMEWSYEHCGTCRNITKKSGTLFNLLESLAYTRDMTSVANAVAMKGEVDPTKLFDGELLSFVDAKGGVLDENKNKQG